MGLRLLVAIALLLSAAPLRAEYRVFVLKIDKLGPNRKPTGESRTVMSNLDPQQYVGYYPIDADEYVTYTDTWRCRGRTSDLDYCPNPKAVSPETPAVAPVKAPPKP